MNSDWLVAGELIAQGPEAVFFVLALNGGLAVLLLSILFVIVRLLLGPSLADRVVALDLVTTLGTAFVVLFALGTGISAYLDAGIALALVGFIATVALARFVERFKPFGTLKDGGTP